MTSWRFHNRTRLPQRHDRLPETSGTLWSHRGALTMQRYSLATGCGIRLYNLQNGIHPLPRTVTLKTATIRRIYIVVLPVVHVSECDVTWIRCEWAVCECYHYFKLQSMGPINKTKISELLSQYLSDYRFIRLQISHSLLIAHVKLGYAYNGPCLHGPAQTMAWCRPGDKLLPEPMIIS